MRHARWLTLLLIVTAATLVSAGDIQVTCEPGLRIYLDGTFVGTSSAREDGLVLTNVPEGPHTIRVEKAGFTPVNFQKNLQIGQRREIPL